MKTSKILNDIEKTKTKIGELQAKLRDLERLKTETENTEIIELVRAIDATPEEIERWQQRQHPITHTITQRGAPIAKEGDRLVFGSRYFYIQGVHEPGSLGIWTIYYAQERSDTHAD